MTTLNPGDLLLIGPACSPQFSGDRALRLRLVSVGEVDPYDGWLWLTGYALDQKGRATDKREVYLRRAGIVVDQRAPTRSSGGLGRRAQTRSGRTKVRACP